MPVRCAVPKCSSTKGSLTASKTGVSYFSTPKDPLMLTQWENNIDLMDGQHLTSKSKVCELHFADSDIVKGKTVRKDGLDTFILHKYWRLKASALPVHLCGSSLSSDVDEHLSPQSSEGMTSNSGRVEGEPTCRFTPLCDGSPISDIHEHLSPQSSEGMTSNSVRVVGEPTCRFVQLGGTNIVNSTIQQNAGEKRLLDTDNLPTESNAAKRNRLDGATLNVSSRTSPEVASTLIEQQANKPGLPLEERVLSWILSSPYTRAKEALLNVKLPSLAWTWVKDTVANGWSCSEFMSFDVLTTTYAIRKRMAVKFETLQVDLSVYGMECHTQDVIPKSYTNNSNLSEAIAHLNEMKICSGARLGHHDITQLAEVKNGILKHGTWRALSCPLLLANNRRQTCSSCSSFSKDIQKRLKRLTFRL